MVHTDGKTAIVTGGGMGIGAAVAAHFAANGISVAILDVNADAAAETVSKIQTDGGDAVAVPCDVSRPDQVTEAVASVVDRFGHVSSLVHCAGICDTQVDFLDITHDAWRRTVEIDLTGAFVIVQATARHMAEQGGGGIVCIASINAHMAEPCYASYNAAKAGILGLIKSAATDLAKHGIRINSVSPGYVDTPMIASLTKPELLDYLRNRFARVPLGRLVKPAEVAAACLFLCSDNASAVTGTDLIVDCGTLANMYLSETFPA